jgi:hypothetical protein
MAWSASCGRLAEAPEDGFLLAFVPDPVDLAVDARHGLARRQRGNGFLRHRFQQAQPDQGRGKARPDHRIVSQRRVGKFGDGDDRRTQTDLLAIGQRRNLFAPFDAELAFRRNDTLHAEDLQLIAVIGMRPGPAVRAVAFQADADHHVRCRFEGHGDVVVPHCAVDAVLFRMVSCRRQSPAIVGVTGRARLGIGSRPASEFRILEPEKSPAVIEHPVAERKQFGLLCVERRRRMQVSPAACVIVAEASTR